MSANNVLAPVGVTFGVNRSWDYTGGLGLGGCIVKNINPSAGTFVWTVLDALFANNIGKQIIFTLGQPADYLVTRAAAGGAAYGSKANMCPDTLTGANSWTTAVQAIVSRAKNTWGRTGLIWELANEIDVAGFYGDPISSLGPYALATTQAILAIDPTAIVISPSISTVTTQSAKMASFLTASDGAGSTAKSWISGIAYHSYKANAYAPTQLVTEWNTMQSVQTSAGISLPTYITESGYAIADPQQAADLQRNMIVAAALGAKCYLGYTYDNGTYAISGVASQWNTAANLLINGAVISSLSVGAYAVQATINGTVYTF